MKRRAHLLAAFALVLHASLASGDDDIPGPPLALPSPSPWSPPPLAPPPILTDISNPPLAGYKDNLFYLRDPHDLVRLYPHGLLDLDAHGFFGAGVNTVPESVAGADLQERFFVRHARFDLAGEFDQHIAFDGGIELVANPAVDGSRVATNTEVALADGWGEMSAGRGFGVWLGVFQAPFSLENRSVAAELPMMERSMPIRGFAASGGGKALGAAIVGSTRYNVLHWEGGGFGAETIAPTDFEQHFDGIGRLVLTPWGDDTTHPLHDIEVGVSARAGARNPRDTTGDMAAITTGQGFALWRPTYVDTTGRIIHILPDALTWGSGLELRVPLDGFVLQSEGYWMSKGTRESPDGLQAVETLRGGTLQGVGWYAELSWWPLETCRLLPENPFPRTDPHADHLELAKTTPAPQRLGFELAVLGGGINARYTGASRSGAPTPTDSQSIELYQFGAAASYWQSSNLRLTVNYNIYVAPTSGSPNGDSTVVPGNLGGAADRTDHVLMELAARASVVF
jgi:hypothetical protein